MSDFDFLEPLNRMLEAQPKYNGKTRGELLKAGMKVRLVFASECGSVIVNFTNGTESHEATVFPYQAADLIITLGFYGEPEGDEDEIEQARRLIG